MFSKTYILYYTYDLHKASLIAQSVKNLLIVQGTWVQSLGQEDPLEKEMATHSSILAWKIPWTEEPAWLQSIGSQRVGDNWRTNTSLHLSCFSHVQLFATLRTVAHQALLSEILQARYWSGLQFPSPGDPPHPGIKPVSFM